MTFTINQHPLNLWIKSSITAIVSMIGCCSLDVSGGDSFASTFEESVLPYMNRYCLDCHSGDKPKAKFDVSPYRQKTDVLADFGHWELILDMLQNKEMPPEDEELQPTEHERKQVIEWILKVKREQAEKNAGDPGIILARRLSNAEYNYTIRDLTGVDIQPTREFPVDPANEEGFDNTGESLTLSPALLKKYLEAARRVSEYLVVKPDGFEFAPHPVLTETDRDKYCVNRIIGFYQQQNTELGDYFHAARTIKVKHTGLFTEGILEGVAREYRLSAKYLKTIWQLLEDGQHHWGPVSRLRALWEEACKVGDAEQVSAKIQAMVDYSKEARAALAFDIPHIRSPGIHNGSQAFVLWRNREKAKHRMLGDLQRLIDHPRDSDAELGLKLPTFGRAPLPRGRDRVADAGMPMALTNAVADVPQHIPTNPEAVASGRAPLPRGRDARDDHHEPENENVTFAQAQAAIERFCAVIPDAFYISERGREFLDPDENRKNAEKGRLLSAGFHSMMGYFRDDQPLYELILDQDQQSELDALWQELDFITFAPMRQHQGLVWFERTDSRFMRSEEFDFARAEDKDVTSEEKIKRLSEVYLAKALEMGADALAAQAIAEHFDLINKSVRWVETSRLLARPSHLRSLIEFARRAYRRPLTARETQDLLSFYSQLMAEGDLSHEDAIRDCVMSILVSPHFWYRFDIPSPQPGLSPLPDIAVANRLSYFLWSSMPDETLLRDAEQGQLHETSVLLGHVRRMVRDDRFRGLAVEFAANWLDFRRFQTHNSVDRKRFPKFTDALRQSMYEEPLHFFMDVAREDRSILDFLYADHTWVDPLLAEHYGISSEADHDGSRWQRVQAKEYGRGGLLPMAVFQTVNAPGLRTSPVKRGYWVVRQVLGEHIPPPPPNVPELPPDEIAMELSLAKMLARHREVEDCATCHEKFDSIGLAFEGYGPVGERRELDLAGRPVENRAVFPQGEEGTGLDGLKEYLAGYRQPEFVNQLCRKLFSYALGRSLIPSDEPVLEAMQTRLAENGYRFHVLLESIVTSPQFLNQRGIEKTARNNE